MTPKQVLNIAAQLYGLTPRQITSPRHDRRYAWARISAMAMARRKSRVGLLAIGSTFHRDHTTVLYAIRRAPQLAKQHPDFKAAFQTLRQILEADVRVYISGPTAGIPCELDITFNIAANRINAVSGCAAINPVTVAATVHWDRDFKDLSAFRRQAMYFRAATTNLIGCDALVHLTGWEHCRAATLEHEIAGACGLTIYPSLQKFLDKYTEQKVPA